LRGPSSISNLKNLIIITDEEKGRKKGRNRLYDLSHPMAFLKP
jgi:hypothetical protein